MLQLLAWQLAGANGLATAPAPEPKPAVESALLRETNAARLGRGLPELRFDEGLSRAARAHAAEMARLNYFSHSSPDPQRATLGARLSLAGVPSVTAAENLALLEGVTDVARTAVQGWLESPGHRTALLSSTYTHVGFGVGEGEGGELYVAQVFARQPHRLLAASAEEVARDGFELRIILDVPQRVSVVPRIAGITGEARTLEAGVRSLGLHVTSGQVQQLVLATALEEAGHFVIQDGGWVTPQENSWQPDPSMPRDGLRIAGVVSSEADGKAVRIELVYPSEAGALALFVDGEHHREALQSEGRLVLYLPENEGAYIQVGEVEGSLVTPFDEFTLIAAPEGPLLLAGSPR